MSTTLARMKAVERRYWWLKPFWKVAAWLVCRKYVNTYYGSWQYAEGLWEIALDCKCDGEAFIGPREALSIDQQYWDEN